MFSKKRVIIIFFGIILFLNCTTKDYLAKINFDDELIFTGYNYEKLDVNHVNFDLFFYTKKIPEKNWFFTIYLKAYDKKTLINKETLSPQYSWSDRWPGNTENDILKSTSKWEKDKIYKVSVPFHLNIDQGRNSIKSGFYDVKLSIISWEQSENNEIIWSSLGYLDKDNIRRPSRMYPLFLNSLEIY